MAAAPTIDRDKARKMVDAMLVYAAANHGDWLWRGLQGDRTIDRYYA